MFILGHHTSYVIISMFTKFNTRNKKKKKQNSRKIFLKVKKNLLVISYTTTATVESLIYDGINDLNLSCPAVSHS